MVPHNNSSYGRVGWIVLVCVGVLDILRSEPAKGNGKWEGVAVWKGEAREGKR